MLKKIALVGFFAFVSTVTAGTATFASTKSAGPAVSVRAPVPKGLCVLFVCH